MQSLLLWFRSPEVLTRTGCASLGEIWAWIIGWGLILEYVVSIAAVAVGWSGYATSLIAGAGIILPAALINPLGTNGGLINLPGDGNHPSGQHRPHNRRPGKCPGQYGDCGNKTRCNLSLPLSGLRSHPATNWVPFMPFGWSGVITGAAIVFFAYIGFDAVSTAAEEVKNPKRDVPIGILSSLAIATVLYIAVSAVLTGIVPYTLFAGTSAPVAFALEQIGISWG